MKNFALLGSVAAAALAWAVPAAAQDGARDAKPPTGQRKRVEHRPRPTAVEMRIKRMRRKFREVDPEFDAIETLYGVGYRYRES